MDAYTDRARAESFGADAGAYDRARPLYPDALIDDLVALRPATVLDVGCGTGRAATRLAARGLSVLGVEVDERMAELARAKGIPVETAAFESWDARGRTFDLVTAGLSWHWFDPVAAARQAYAVLRAGGSLALFWNHAELDPPVRDTLDAVYRQRAPQLLDSMLAVRNSGVGQHIRALDASGLFGPVEQRGYRWDSVYTRDAWLDMIATHSDHRVLADAQRAEVLRGVGAAIDGLGGTLVAHVVTELLLARRR